MKRELDNLTRDTFDLVVIGGGIFGACAAWDAVQRGLSVALIERDDFGGATSANSYKIVHGGIRYIQHFDIYRVRQSSNERRGFLKVAPHLVHPLPIVIPTYGHGMKGKSVLRVGMGLYDLVTADKNRGIADPERWVPWGRILSRAEALELFPGLDQKGLTGAAVFCDGHMYNPPRLVLAFVQNAVQAGAVAANHVEATGFLREGDRVVGVKARDVLTDSALDIRSKVVLNAAGPYAERLLMRGADVRLTPPGVYSRDACFVVPRRLLDNHYALAVQGKTRDPEAVFSRGERHLFLAPWRDHTVVGTWHVVHKDDPDAFTVTDDELLRFIDEVNSAYPALKLTLDDVSIWNAGLVPFGENPEGAQDLRYGHRSRL
ncbi:MAG: FAD-dependent oxidoreductase, partial [Gemmatimonadota bacterium]